jgi:signal transduction histidine kinase
MSSLRPRTYSLAGPALSRTRDPSPGWGGDPSLLDAVIPTLKTGLWEATQGKLRVLSLNFGATDQPIISISKARLRDGFFWDSLVCPLDTVRMRTFLDRPDSVGGGKSVDYRIIVESGELLWVRHRLLQRVHAPQGNTILRGLVTAIPEQKHLEWECLRVSERECNRIGQELHDDLCQVLAGLSYMMQVLARRAGKADPALGDEIDELNIQVAEAMERARSMAHGLFPAQLNYATLRHALKEFVRQMKSRFPAKITLELPRNLPSHSPEQIIHIYRITQEAVTNSLRHGDATAIRIAARVQPGAITFSIEDNGKGLPALSARPEGIGMHVMSYRARILGGEIAINNQARRGATVQLSYPVAVLRKGRKTKPTHSSEHA